MCGICGWIHKEGVDRKILESMTRRLRHRGPDAQQVEILGSVGLGHARLSIIDLSEQGNQPICNEDKSLYLVYNGEFYNYNDYRENLIKQGHTFKSRTDSEVVLHLFEEEGLDFLQKIRGMFAFAIWNRKNKELLLVRDRVGIKPLYYYHDGRNFIFASELKAILQHPEVSKKIDPDALSAYFTMGYIPREMSIFKSIKKLLPGHYLIFKDTNFDIHRYWLLPEVDRRYDFSDEESLIEELYALLEESVRLRLISDVPLGLFLSGGIDSSIVASLAAKNSTKPIKTFSIGFDTEKYDELFYARTIAEHIGAEHHEFIVSLDDADILNKLMYFYDEPFADSSAIPTYYVSDITRARVKVALSGDGGDELFGGYNWYIWTLKQNELEYLPLFFRNFISNISTILPINYKGRHFLSVLNHNEYETFHERIRFFSEDELSNLLRFPIISKHRDTLKRFYLNAGNDALERMTRTDFSYYLPDDILTKVDRASMAVSLEARVPLLDHKVCEFAFSLPDKFKIRNGIKKYVLKKLAGRLLPPRFQLERKQGFSIPLKEWMQGNLGNTVIDAQHNAEIKCIINEKLVKDLLLQHRSGLADNGQKLWAILIFALWADKYL